MGDMVQLLFRAVGGGTAKVRTETSAQRREREATADEQANKVFGLSPAQRRVLSRARTSR
jgi:hypothetical protein